MPSEVWDPVIQMADYAHNVQMAVDQAAYDAEQDRLNAAEDARVAAVAAARAPVASTPRSGAVTSLPAGGPCGSSAPPGFPGSVIQRESGGDPNAVNGSSGAYGCAQILPSHFSSGGCQGMSYDQCWAYLWAGGAGASNWALTYG